MSHGALRLLLQFRNVGGIRGLNKQNRVLGYFLLCLESGTPQNSIGNCLGPYSNQLDPTGSPYGQKTHTHTVGFLVWSLEFRAPCFEFKPSGEVVPLSRADGTPGTPCEMAAWLINPKPLNPKPSF